MNAIFNIIGIPLGYVLWFIYRFVGNYFVSIFLFTLIVRAATFPLSLKSQKSQADRARLAPRLERIQKKYAQDKQKLQQKQMELYEKEGVSMTGGCLPMVVQMVILMGIISVIYSPLTHLARIPEPVISASVTAVTQPTVKNDKGYTLVAELTGTDEEEELIASFDVTLIRNTFADEIENPLYLCSVSSMKMTQKEGADVSEGGTATLIPDETITATFNGLSDAHTAEMTLSEGDIRAFQFDAESAAGKIISGLNEGDVVTFGYIVDKRNGSYVIVSAE